MQQIPTIPYLLAQLAIQHLTQDPELTTDQAQIEDMNKLLRNTDGYLELKQHIFKSIIQLADSNKHEFCSKHYPELYI